MQDERFHPFELGCRQIRFKERPGVITTQRAAPFQNPELQLRALLPQPIGGQTTGQTTPGENDVVFRIRKRDEVAPAQGPFGLKCARIVLDSPRTSRPTEDALPMNRRATCSRCSRKFRQVSCS